MSRLGESIYTLALRSRMAAPDWARKLYRAFRSLEAAPESRRLPQEALEGCRFVASRFDLLDHLPRQGRVAELGTHTGGFAREILARCDPAELHVIDLDYARFDASLRADARLTAHEGFTHEVIARFPDAHFDWVYVDADHSYEGALRDARAAAPKVRTGGYLVFNDFAHAGVASDRYGVHRAVTDFALESGWPFAYFAYHPQGLYDVALRRPPA